MLKMNYARAIHYCYIFAQNIASVRQFLQATTIYVLTIDTKSSTSFLLKSAAHLAVKNSTK